MKSNGASPNFLIFMVDEERYPPPYETEEIKAWRKEYLKAQGQLRQTGVEFHRHYAAATACCPSRTSLFTGHYPSLHGVTQTTGTAKSPFDPSMFWLDPNTVPTLGDYFRAAGYRTFYKGKWHISNSDIIIPGTHDVLPTYTDDSQAIDRNIDMYLRADRLDEYGFSGWIGPEPHGSAQVNSGTNRDAGFAQQAIDLLNELEAEREAAGGRQSAPWFIVNSYVNPHDIVLYGVQWQAKWGYDFTDDTVPDIPRPETEDEDLDTKPRCQKSYVDVYPKMVMPQLTTELYRKFYYYLQKVTDELVQKVYDKLRASPFFENTIVIYTSDHGDMLGAHGGMHQKWYNAYEESIHVPLIISSPTHFGEPKSVDMLTSHADVLPTLLALAGADQREVQEVAARDHCEVRPLVGRDLSALLLGDDGRPPREPVYFMTDDEMTEGLTPYNPGTGREYRPVVQPGHIETVIASFPAEEGEHIWKFSRYFDNPDFWSNPDMPKDGRKKRRPARDEYEMYDLTLDPLEKVNLAHPSNRTPETRKRQKELQALLAEQSARKRLTPSYKTEPGIPAGDESQSS